MLQRMFPRYFISSLGDNLLRDQLHWPTPSGLTEVYIQHLCENTTKNVNTSEACVDYIDKHRSQIMQICIAGNDFRIKTTSLFED